MLQRIVLATALSLCTAAAFAIERAWPGADWETATPESQGMSSASLAALVSWASFANVDSIVVTRGGRLVTEAFFAPYDTRMKHRINSATKAVTGALVGIAAQQGLVDPAASATQQLGVQPRDDGMRAVTLQQLVDMTSGMDWHEPLTDEFPRSLVGMERSRDWVRYVLEQPMARAPGAEFNYNTGNSQLASALLARKAGMSTRDFAVKNLFEPIGIRDLRWRADPQGVHTGGFGIYLHPRDMARFGYLYLNHGEWNGRQVVPRAWVDKVFDAKITMHPMANWNYAQGWWTLPSRKAILAVGYARQLVIVLPEQGVVASFTGRGGYAIENVVDKLIAAVKADEAIAADAQGEAQLRGEIARVAVRAAPVHASGAVAPAHRKYKFGANPVRLRSVTFDFDGTGRYELEWDGEPALQGRPLGLTGWTEAPPWRGEVAWSRAQWVAPGALKVAVRWPEEARDQFFDLRFEGDRVDVTFTPQFGKPMRFSGQAQ